jgi:hypothetical protein
MIEPFSMTDAAGKSCRFLSKRYWVFGDGVAATSVRALTLRCLSFLMCRVICARRVERCDFLRRVRSVIALAMVPGRIFRVFCVVRG